MKTALTFILAAFAFGPEQSNPSKAATSETLLTPLINEPLTDVSLIRVGASHLQIEPGVRVTGGTDRFTFSTHDGSNIEFKTSTGAIYRTSPVIAKLDNNGLQFDFGSFSTDTVLARRAAQDDTDSNLKSMQESAKKLKAKTTNQDNAQPNKKLRVRWLYGENPMPTAELFNSAAIQQLTHTSPIGF